MRIPFFVLFLLIGPALATACPDQREWGEQFSFSGDELYSERVINVTAGGDVDLSRCSNMPGTGYVIVNPDFTVRYRKTARYNIRFRTRAKCDTVLLVNDANGGWHWDDDSAGNTNAEVWLRNAADGLIDIWVGTHQPANCDAQLLIETFD